MSHWLNDVRVTTQGVQVRKTGHFIPLSLGTAVDGLKWLEFEQALKREKRVGGEPIKVCFLPDTPRPWYFARAYLSLLNAEIVADPGLADVVWAFDDATHSDEIATKAQQIRINTQCTDISKSRVGALSEAAFGTKLAVNPETFEGLMVAKSEVNGAHDGMVVKGPAPAEPGVVYQRLIDNRRDDGLVEDLRTTIIGGEPVLVFLKRRPTGERFTNSNTEVELVNLEEVFSDKEIQQIKKFAKLLNLDVGGVDVLRDRQSGDLFIVDANKTDMGPPFSLPLHDKLKATRMMAEALNTLFTESRSDEAVLQHASVQESNGTQPLIEVAA